MPNGKKRQNGGPLPRFPLPGDSRALVEAIHQDAQNIGLLFNKFIWIWDDNWSLEATFKEGKRERKVKSWFLEQVKAIARSFPRDAYFAFLNRQMQMIQSLRGHGYKTTVFGKRTGARILSGLGGAHPMEVGFTFHPLYGFPYLPGSGLKGLARAWSELTGLPAEKIKLVFGSESKDERQAKEHHQGDVLFLDAYSISPPGLEVDILNPHFPEYYREPKRNLPTEWQSPNPVNFLTIGVGDREEDRPVFQFALLARSEEALQLAQEWVERGLEELGFGGKTASGYGYFAKGRIPGEELAKLREAELAKVPPQKRQVIQVSSSLPEPTPAKRERTPSSSLEQKPRISRRPPTPVVQLKTKQGDKIDAEVIANYGGKVTVRLLQGLNQEVTFDHAYYPHGPGKKVKVKVVSISSEGKIFKVAPA